MNMAGSFYSDEQYQIVFRVDKCVNLTLDGGKTSNCAPMNEINDFISKIKIETWVANFDLDF